MAGQPRSRARKIAQAQTPAAQVHQVSEEPASYTVTRVDQCEPAKPKIGRPSTKSPEIVEAICDAIAADEGSLAAICEGDESLPSFRTVMRWLNDDELFRHRYARAREQQADASSHRMREIERRVEVGTLAPDAARVMLDSIKWRASKLDSKRFGDRLTLAGDEDAPLHLSVARQVEHLSADARARIARELAGSGADDADVVQALPKPT